MVPWSANCAPIMTSWMPPRSQSVFDVSCATVRCVQHAMCLRKTKKGAGAGKNRDAVAVHVASPAHRHPSRIPGGSARDAEAIGAIDGGEEERIREGARGVVDARTAHNAQRRASNKTLHTAHRKSHADIAHCSVPELAFHLSFVARSSEPRAYDEIVDPVRVDIAHTVRRARVVLAADALNLKPVGSVQCGEE
eukprot:1946640-Rhodomonas_salina.2